MCWDVARGRLWFTKNGRKLPGVIPRVRRAAHYVAVAVGTKGARVHANFGQEPFKVRAASAAGLTLPRARARQAPPAGATR